MKVKNKPIIISICANKGGVGKSQSVQSLGAYFQRTYRLKTLLVDFDYQSNLSEVSFDDSKLPELNIYDLLCDVDTNLLDVHKAIVHLEDYDILCGSANLTTFQEQQRGKLGSDRKLQEVLQKFNDEYDIIIIDNNSSTDLLFNNSIAASKFAIITTEAEKASISGAMKTISLIDLAKKYYNIEVLGILVVKYDSRTNIGNDTLNLLLTNFPGLTYKYGIPSSVAVANSRRYYMNIYEFNKASSVATAYSLVGDETIERLIKKGEITK